MKKYYISFVITKYTQNNYQISNQDNIYGDIFINVDKYIDENIIKNIKEEIRKSRKLDKSYNITFLNITDLSEKEFDSTPFRGSEALPKEINNEEMEKMEKIVKETIIETSNGQRMDSSEIFFNKK